MEKQPPSSIADWLVEYCQLLDRKEQLEHELLDITNRLTELSGRGVGKRSSKLQLIQAAEIMELERRCNERDHMTTEKQVIMEFIKDMLKSQNRKLSDATSLYDRYRKRLTRWRNKHNTRT